MVPGPLDQRTGGYLYDARMVRELRARGWEVVVHELEGVFPVMLGDAGAADPAVAAMEGALAGLPDGALVLLDGLAMGGMPEPGPLSRHGGRLALVSLVHHPLWEEPGADAAAAAAAAAALRARESAALAHCRGVITTSPHTARGVEAMGVPRDRIRVVPPGTDPAPLSRGPAPGEPAVFLCVATVVPRKGHRTLMEALALLDARAPAPWRCRLVGSLTRSPETVAALRSQIRRLGLDDRVELAGEVSPEALDAAYDGASAFVLASHHEGFGMVLTEALARGLPLVSTTGGAIPDTVPPSAVAELVPPGDAEALADALARTLEVEADPEARAGLKAQARLHAEGLLRWPEAAGELETALRELAPPRHATFQAAWLELREPVDHRSRAGELMALLPASVGASRAVDLGSGTGSNVRYLARHMEARGWTLPWVLVDHDAALLAQAARGLEGVPGVRSVESVQGDLAVEGLDAVRGAGLVTASALLDLVSRRWVEALVEATSGAAVLLALTYNGQVQWADPHPLDLAVHAAVNAHQHRDKGLGGALGPEGARVAEACFQAAGYWTRRLPAPWILGSGDLPLLRPLLDGWIEAAAEAVGEAAGASEAKEGSPRQASPIGVADVRAWGAARHAQLDAADAGVDGAIREIVRVGHDDLLALPGSP